MLTITEFENHVRISLEDSRDLESKRVKDHPLYTLNKNEL